MASCFRSKTQTYLFNLTKKADRVKCVGRTSRLFALTTRIMLTDSTIEVEKEREGVVVGGVDLSVRDTSVKSIGPPARLPGSEAPGAYLMS